MKYAIRREASAGHPYLGPRDFYVVALADAKHYNSIVEAMPDLRDAALSGDPVWVVGIRQVLEEVELG